MSRKKQPPLILERLIINEIGEATLTADKDYLTVKLEFINMEKLLNALIEKCEWHDDYRNKIACLQYLVKGLNKHLEYLGEMEE